ncbi:MAG: GGDEF domain-containing protein [Thermoleophilia bacterium]|nr:GGDEF domain-containing protein [Thermoleophilia bacterium]
MADAIAFHHGGRSSQDCPNAVAACVQIANCLVGMIAGLEPDHEVLNLALAKLDLSMDALDELGGAVAGQASESPSGLTARVQKLERLVGEDPLTGVANRRHWLELLGGRLRAGHDLAVIICDVDHFKELNDRFGHATGDAVLIGVANVLGAAGTVGRLGGDEFALFVPGSVEDGVAAAQGAMEALNAGLPDLDAAALVSLSMGVSSAPGHGTEPSELLRRADEALYEAKRSGRSRVAAAQ